MNKKYLYKVYDKGGTLLETINNNIIKNEISFSSKINDGQGDLTIELRMQWDDPESWTDAGNRIRVYVIDSENPLGRLIYGGKITKRIPTNSADDDEISLVCVGLVDDLKILTYKDGASFVIQQTAVDPDVIIEDIIDKYQAAKGFSSSPEWIGYDTVTGIRTGSQIENFGSNVTYQYENLSGLEAIEATVEITESGWYYYIDQGGDVLFKKSSTTADHSFMMEHDVQKITPPENTEEIINSITFEYNGGVTAAQEDATSISTYGKQDRGGSYTDKNISDEPTAILKAQKILAENKDPKIQAVLTLNSLYDFESIKPGDTCKVQNYKKGSVVLSDNMLIVSVSYTPEFCTLELGGFQFDITKETQKLSSSVAIEEIQKRGLIVSGGGGIITSVFGRSTPAIVAATNDYTWNQINKATSSIADITTKSHTLLTDIGSNTHAQIDTHIGDATKHFLYGSINHNTIVNAHNLTTDIDHDSILNNHNLTTDIDHATITNGHNLTTDIDHDSILNGIGGNKHIDWTNATNNFLTSGTISGSFTTGSVLFSGASGLISEDNSGIFYDVTNHRFGLGITTPARQFVLYKAVTAEMHFQNATSGSGVNDGFQLAFNASDAYMWNWENGSMRFATNNIERMRIQSNGDVGIGIAPSVRFHVYDTVADDVNGLMQIRNGNTGTGAVTNSQLIMKNKYGSGQFMQWQQHGVRIGSRILTGGTGDVIFTAGADSEKMRIKAGGNVLFGTTTDAGYKADINGTFRTVDDAQFDADVNIDGNCFVGDRGAEGTAQVVNVITYTGTIPAASTVPIGTLAFKRATT